MASKVPKVEMFFFPYVGGGHQIPMTDIARVFASHGAKSTIITTPTNSLLFQKFIQRDQQSGHDINLHSLQLPSGGAADLSDVSMSATPATDTSILRQPFELLLQRNRPDCIVIDMFHRWAAEVVDGLDIPRIIFTGNGCFSRCAHDSVTRYEPHEKVNSDYEPFVLPGLPHRIELTRSQLPPFLKTRTGFSDRMGKSEEKSFGTVVNSFYELEPEYVEYFKKEMGKKAWLVGPVCVCNRNVEDKAERGQKASIDEHSCLSWLNSKKPNSVLYVSFGSLARLAPEQLLEIAYGLEASNHPFIWVVGKISNTSGKAEDWIPDGFEKRMIESKKALIIRGWAPQLLILEHAATGGFMTHCGWNSTTEGVSAGVPMITWPLSAEQFSNEKLITDVLRIGVQVGNVEWVSWNSERKAAVGREMVAEAVERLMGGGDEMVEMRKRAKEIGEKAKRAVEEGGSSYADADALIEELKLRRKMNNLA